MKLCANVVARMENSQTLCTGEKGKVSTFHRIIPSASMCQGGDSTNCTGTGCKCIYGNKFKDEDFRLKHTAPGIPSMANAAASTPTGRKFFFTTVKTWTASKRTVFGSVVEGMEVSKKVKAYGLQTSKTSKKIVINDGGVL
ncbi:hypothetical protein HPB48_005101 [Haemaphysalis longicornis]|uniref:Peptidyl-prolyl cis-trans isomerase n=1 Tax=Haemaphysalis longicornis TaxID=44386 RepID=A0A9J6FF95_HAELO|nr:hypothetical protein HPB48_005101 [Haemaphysalis longicornis]